MTIEQDVAALTTATTALLTAVNVSKTTLDTKVADATAQVPLATAQVALAADQVALATTQKTLATTQATNAATSAALALTRAETATTQAAAATAAALGASNIVLGVSTLYPAIRPTLDLDFANGQTVDPRITFTRASTATRTNSRGLIEAVASGVPRIDFDPVTGVCKGLLIEEQRANLLTYSEAFDNAAWTKIRATVTANATIAPDGLLTADKLVEDATASNSHVMIFPYSVSSGSTYTFSFFVKSSERSSVLASMSSSFPANSDCSFNSTTGVASNVLASSFLMSPVGNGWHRCSLTATASATGTANLSIYIQNGTISYTGDGTSGLFIWGAQLEAGAFPTSYIPTVASQVTRAADVASMTGANFSSWYRQDEGSFVVGASLNRDPANATFPGLYRAGSDNTNRISSFIYGNTNTPYSSVITSGVAQVDMTSGTDVSVGNFTASIAYKTNDFAISVNGATSTLDASGVIPATSVLEIGGNFSGSTALNGHIRSLSYYPKRLTNAELQALSTQ